MSWSDFDDESALERNMLERALPLIPIFSDGSISQTIDLDLNRMDARISVSDTTGPTANQCVDLLQIRPLLVGAAWKIIDLLLEEALEQFSMTPSRGGRWTIKEKVWLARTATARPSAFDTTSWTALMDTYVSSEQIRHSLVHRKAHTDLTGALFGMDDAGNPLRPLQAQEQESLARTATLAARVVTSRQSDARLNAVLLYELSQLTGLHGQAISANKWTHAPRQVIVPLTSDPSNPGHYLMDIPKLRASSGLGGDRHVDLIVQFKDRPGQELHGRLEDAPNSIEPIEPSKPPTWLT